MYWGGFSPPANPSKWRRDMINLDDWRGRHWFNEEVMRIVDNGIGCYQLSIGMFVSHDIGFLKW